MGFLFELYEYLCGRVVCRQNRERNGKKYKQPFKPFLCIMAASTYTLIPHSLPMCTLAETAAAIANVLQVQVSFGYLGKKAGFTECGIAGKGIAYRLCANSKADADLENTAEIMLDFDCLESNGCYDWNLHRHCLVHFSFGYYSWEGMTAFSTDPILALELSGYRVKLLQECILLGGCGEAIHFSERSSDGARFIESDAVSMTWPQLVTKAHAQLGTKIANVSQVSRGSTGTKHNPNTLAALFDDFSYLPPGAPFELEEEAESQTGTARAILPAAPSGAEVFLKTCQQILDNKGPAAQALPHAEEAFSLLKSSLKELEANTSELESPDFARQLRELLRGFPICAFVFMLNNQMNLARQADNYYMHTSLATDFTMDVALKPYFEWLTAKHQRAHLEWIFSNERLRSHFQLHYNAYIIILVNPKIQINGGSELVDTLNRIDYLEIRLSGR